MNGEKNTESVQHIIPEGKMSNEPTYGYLLLMMTEEEFKSVFTKEKIEKNDLHELAESLKGVKENDRVMFKVKTNTEAKKLIGQFAERFDFHAIITEDLFYKYHKKQ